MSEVVVGWFPLHSLFVHFHPARSVACCLLPVEISLRVIQPGAGGPRSWNFVFQCGGGGKGGR